MEAGIQVVTPPPTPGARLNELKSTPQSGGAATNSEFRSSLRVADLRYPILHDILKHDSCKLRDMVGTLLWECRAEDRLDGDTTKETLLIDCLEKVVPLCEDSTLRKEMNNFSKAFPETARYPPLAHAMNRALYLLHDLHLHLPLRKPNARGLLFAQNDPKTIKGTQVPQSTSVRKPDLVAAFAAAICAAFGLTLPTELNKEVIHKLSALVACTPSNGFSWPDVLQSLELKVTPSPPNRKCSASYSSTLTVEVPWEQVPRDPHEPQIASIFSSRKRAAESDPDQQNKRSKTVKSNPIMPSTAAPPSTEPPLVESEPSTSKATQHMKPLTEGGPQVSAVVQCALYGAEMLSSSARRAFALNFILRDTVAHIWYYDSQGAIQTTGFDIIQDLPYLLVLLLAFQRFSDKQWGYVSDFQEDPGRFPRHGKNNSSSILQSYKVQLRDAKGIHITAKVTAQSPVYSGLILSGRRTVVLPAKIDGVEDENKYVLKLYWPERSRVSEVDFLADAAEIASQDTKVAGHIPTVVAFSDFEEYRTDNIRAALGLEERGGRVLRAILFPELVSVTSLKDSRDVWRALKECFHCHYGLYSRGLQHHDVSINNIMYDAQKGRGVLNDWDLAHSTKRQGSLGRERTGTMPFMALDLLTAPGWMGQVERLYRHDCESFAWVMVWICGRYDSGQEILQPPFQGWIKDRPEDCRGAKSNILTGAWRQVVPTPSFAACWTASLRHLFNLIPREDPVLQAREKSDKDIYEESVLILASSI
ncbi:hypothetical protein BDN71DRAFT_1443306 [Pleurotus eryngii]|uniref:Fungal-type protein kinase domain-containing protein n=1 Tax=Pleurotus eryngii TaxID=5323 RepID=A0A9P6A3P9_PLEER|nr:hypothetical protein BDN71DRAFT_1443306 [Pleurotus eryngii]